MHSTEQALRVWQYSHLGWQSQHLSIIGEAAISLTVNGEGWISFSCTPTNLEALAAGFLYNEAVISSANEISSAQIERQSSSASVSA